MPSTKSTDPGKTPSGTTEADTAPPKAATAAGDEPTPRAWEFTFSIPTVYGHIPLTAHPAIPASAGQPARPATVFAWPAGPPDGRWTQTDQSPNQGPDNDPTNLTEG